MKNKLKRYRPQFSEARLWRKLAQFAQRIGVKIVYTVLLLFYAYKRKETPRWAKNVVLGALGYFIMIFDAVPDVAPFIGYTDDLGILFLGLSVIAAYIDDEVQLKAREKLEHWFKTYDEDDLKEVDKRF